MPEDSNNHSLQDAKAQGKAAAQGWAPLSLCGTDQPWPRLTLPFPRTHGVPQLSPSACAYEVRLVEGGHARVRAKENWALLQTCIPVGSYVCSCFGIWFCTSVPPRWERTLPCDVDLVHP